MFAPVRVVATIVFLGSIGLVFVGAFVLGNDVSAHMSPDPLSFLAEMLFLFLQVLCISTSIADEYPFFSSNLLPCTPSFRHRRVSGIHVVQSELHSLRKVCVYDLRDEFSTC